MKVLEELLYEYFMVAIEKKSPPSSSPMDAFLYRTHTFNSIQNSKYESGKRERERKSSFIVLKGIINKTFLLISF
jgi:hypothetical protein